MNIIIDVIGKIRDILLFYERVNIVEVMGRYCGDLVLYVGFVGGVEIIIVLEVEIIVDEVVLRLKII